MENEEENTSKKLKPSYQYVDSGNIKLDFEYKRVAHQCTNVIYDLQYEKAICNVLELIENYHTKKGFIIKRLIFDLTENVNRKGEKFKGSDMSNIVLQSELKQIANTEKIIDWLNEKINTLGTTKSSNKESENPHPQIFIDAFAYKVFESLHENFKTSRYLLADYSFIYRKMLFDHLIHEYATDTVFRQWLNKAKKVDIEKTKTLDRCSTEQKEITYGTIKASIKQ